jgi:IclR family transcriptional regulator, pca regulon regulatory protein
VHRPSSKARHADAGRLGTAPRAALPVSQAAQDKEFMTTLAKGFAVLGLFGRDRPRLTLSEAAASTDLSRATARRILRTLTGLGYLEQDGRHFALGPGILNLGFSYLAAQSWIERAHSLMKELSQRFQESCSAAILQDTDVVYVARVPAGRIMSVAISVGTHLPAFHTALGRAQLGFLDDAELWRRIKSLRLDPYTPSTIVDLQALHDRVRTDHDQGFSLVDEELERGLRAVAVPVLDRAGQAVGALNLSTHSTRTTRGEMREHFLPALREAAGEIAAYVV